MCVAGVCNFNVCKYTSCNIIYNLKGSFEYLFSEAAEKDKICQLSDFIKISHISCAGSSSNIIRDLPFVAEEYVRVGDLNFRSNESKEPVFASPSDSSANETDEQRCWREQHPHFGPEHWPPAASFIRSLSARKTPGWS